ncbi:hypothetical protein E8E14_013987 [Neopestalotiopsis sp. 37M]|nr:hypothetical protein E8E14_013987 [Neopestalotiopsis sp. 37M]
MRGGFWPVLNRIVTACVWMGIQAYWGGQAVKIMLRAIIGPTFVNLRNTLPSSSNTDTASLISFFVFIVIFLPLPMIPPEKLQMPFRITFVMITATMFGMLGWAMSAAGGPGVLMSTPATLSGSALSWNAVFGLQSIIGSQASGCLGQSDWTRYARSPNSALFGQFVTAPIFIVVTALCGILITSGAATIYGEYIWNPFELLLTIQNHSMTPAARAGSFFAGLGFLTDQLALCQMLNGISTGMDMAALCPNPMTGIVVSDYFMVRRGEYHIGDLYLGDQRSAYWYTHGFNFRGFAAWILGMAPLLPGFARAVQGSSNNNGWDHIYQIAYFYGFVTSFTTYYLFYLVFPQERQRGTSPFVLDLQPEIITGADALSDQRIDIVVTGEKKTDGREV